MVFCVIPKVKVWLSLVPGSFRKLHQDFQQRREAYIKRNMVIMPLLFLLSLLLVWVSLSYPPLLFLLLCSCVFQYLLLILSRLFIPNYSGILLDNTSVFLIYQRTHMVTLPSFSVLLLFHSTLTVLGFLDNFDLLRQHVFLCVSVTSTLCHSCLSYPSWLFFFFAINVSIIYNYCTWWFYRFTKV